MNSCFLLGGGFETGFLCGFGACPGTSSCGLGWSRRDLPTSASQVLGLKVCTTNAQLNSCFLEVLSLEEIIVGSQLFSVTYRAVFLKEIFSLCITFVKRWSWLTWRSCIIAYGKQYTIRTKVARV